MLLLCILTFLTKRLLYTTKAFGQLNASRLGYFNIVYLELIQNVILKF